MDRRASSSSRCCRSWRSSPCSAELAVAGQAVWLAGTAARAGARTHALGGDALAGARSAVPLGLRERVRVRELADGRVRVRLAVPVVLGSRSLGTVSREARFAPQGER